MTKLKQVNQETYAKRNEEAQKNKTSLQRFL